MSVGRDWQAGSGLGVGSGRKKGGLRALLDSARKGSLLGFGRWTSKVAFVSRS
jgi:hypothetical protein